MNKKVIAIVVLSLICVVVGLGLGAEYSKYKNRDLVEEVVVTTDNYDAAACVDREIKSEAANVHSALVRMNKSIRDGITMSSYHIGSENLLDAMGDFTSEAKLHDTASVSHIEYGQWVYDVAGASLILAQYVEGEITDGDRMEAALLELFKLEDIGDLLFDKYRTCK